MLSASMHASRSVDFKGSAKLAHRIVLSVRNRIHWGIGRFCFAFFASFILMRKVFCDGCSKTVHGIWSGGLKLSFPAPKC